MKSLQEDNSIVILKPNKGNGIAILDKDDYRKKMDEILNDSTKFAPLLDDPIKTTMTRENKLRCFLKDLMKTGSVTLGQFNSLSTSGSRPGILNGLPKVHKPNIPLRPILSAIGTHSYNLAKFFVPLLHPISSGSYLIKDFFSFIQDLFSLDLNSNNLIMASFDINSLFTNVLIDET